MRERLSWARVTIEDGEAKVLAAASAAAAATAAGEDRTRCRLRTLWSVPNVASAGRKDDDVRIRLFT